MYRDMTSELRGWIAKLALPLSETLVNRALQKIYDSSTWSFQLGESGWFTPGLVASLSNTTASGGTITATLFEDTVVGDATASAAWLAIPSPFDITLMQIRSPAYSLYNVVSINSDDPTAVVLTLDRPWSDPAGAGLSYMLYQAYYPAPVADFKRFLCVRDFTNAIYLDFWSWKQSDVAAKDPQRTVFQNPDHVVPYRANTWATGDNADLKGRMMFELYPQQLARLPYALYWVRNGDLLVNPTDTVPYPLDEETVLHRAKMLAYEWAEANKSRYIELLKTNWLTLMQRASAEYDDRLKDIRKKDRDICDNFITRMRRTNTSVGAPYYSAVTGQASVGIFGR